MPARSKKQLAIRPLRWSAGEARAASDAVAVEEPLEIRLGGRRFTITMRTPGDDEELAAGFLHGEGFINSRAELGEIRRVRDAKGIPEPNALDIVLNVPAERLRERLSRNFTINSSCGICGRTSIESLSRRISPIKDEFRVRAQKILAIAPKLRASQQVFAATGGLHAAARFDRAGELLATREDIGRHNAVDKIVGHALMNDQLPLTCCIVMVSGRLSFEIVQKAAAAGAPILAAVSAPSSLAVELAEEMGLTLIGFLREGGFNIYTHPDRVIA